MDYKVYLNNKVIVLTDDLGHSKNTFFYDAIVLDEIIHRLQYSDTDKVILYTPYLSKAWEDFKKHFDVIEAAGGLVKNKNKEYLFIYRNGKWDLPKGKMEKGEIPDQTAIREVQEECGIENISIEKFLFDTYHLFNENRKKRLKITHWFLMNQDKKSSISPQTEEGIEKVEWINIHDNPDVLKDSYENIKLLFNTLA